MEKISPKKFKSDYDGIHNVKYCTYYDPDDNIKVPTEKEAADFKAYTISKGICFFSLNHEMRDRGKGVSNRIMYFILDVEKKHTLSLEEKVNWIKLGVENGTLPEYMLEEDPKDNRFVLKADSISPSLLYVYLSTLRNMQENSQFVRTALTLVNIYKIDYIAAFVAASKHNLRNSWHSIVGLGKDYGASDITKLLIPLSIIIALKRYLKDPTKYDKRKFPVGVQNFNASMTIRGATKLNRKMGVEEGYHCNINQLLDTTVKEAIEAEEDETAKKYMVEAKIKE